MRKGKDGSDDPEFQEWNSQQTLTCTLAVPFGKQAHDLYKGEIPENRERVLQRILREEEEKEMAANKDIYEQLFDDLDE
jgi:hypothetical protein